MEALLYILLFILGACIGSFLCCQARRLHLRQGKTKKSLPSRSICLSCKTQLKWYDNLPIISWLALRGKCRKCHHQIGLAEFLSEPTLAFAFLALGLSLKFGTAATLLELTNSSPLFWAYFVAIFIFTTSIAFLAIYDGLYGELPVKYLTLSIICGIIVLCLKEWLTLSISPFTPNLIWEPLAAVAILGGLYLALYLVSKGKWVGDGDWLLGTAIGLALGTPWLAFLALFIANLLACLIMAPAAFKRKKSQIYFGPFLAIAFMIVYSFCAIITI